MKYKEFNERVLESLVNYKEKVMHIKGKGVWSKNNKSYPHILPDSSSNLLPQAAKFKQLPSIKLHTGAAHLNSSQMMCINFFSPLFKDDKRLIELICKQLNLPITPDMKITNKQFEYTPNGPKHTNFDFYVELSTGEKFYFEIKYTERKFGGVSIDSKYPERYEKEWECFYKDQTDKSKYFKDILQKDFYKNYQINRNIAYITAENAEREFVCFVYPYDNGNLHKEAAAVQTGYSNVEMINWDDFCETALNICQGTEYYEHY